MGSIKDFNKGKKKKETVKEIIISPEKLPLKIIISILITVAIGLVAFYIMLPPLNIHAQESYLFVGSMVLLYGVVHFAVTGAFRHREYIPYMKRQIRVLAALIAVLVVVFVVGSVSSAVIFRSKSYAALLEVKQGDFAAEVEEISFNQVPMLDKDSAEKLGDRKMGELSELVSQFEVADDYSQINFQDSPVRVTPLNYGDFFKWFKNREQGIPAYLIIDMVTQEVTVKKLEGKGIQYSQSELFGRKLERYLRFQFPTHMFGNPVFEIDEEETPYWVCPVITKRIGLFGGTDIKGIVLLNAITGECQEYDIEDVPEWIDRAFSADLLVEQYDYYGRYKKGFWNSLIGQSGVTITTQGYNYIAQNDDVYMYTGITSVTGDQSNIGFLLVNQRTKDATYYEVPGATESSAMGSAKGAIQHLNYNPTFPLLLNISGQPTYFIALKDDSNLVKMYAMVNVNQYQIVATGTTLESCTENYINMLSDKNVGKNITELQEKEIKGTIQDIRTAVMDGNSFYYIRLDNGKEYYMISAAEQNTVVTFNIGDKVIITAAESESEIVKAKKIERIK